MEIKIDKNSTDESKRIESIVSEVISLVGDVVSEFDFQKKRDLNLLGEM